MRETIATHPDAAVVNGPCERIFADGQPWMNPGHDAPWDVIHVQNVIEQPSTFWRAELHKKVGPLDESYRLAFDWEHWCRMRADGAKLVRTTHPLSRYHFSDDNKSGSAGNDFADEAFKLIERHGPGNGRVARMFKKLYWSYDLHGAMDDPPTGPFLKRLQMKLFFAWCVLRGDAKWLRLYNWHFASQQQRGIKWW